MPVVRCALASAHPGHRRASWELNENDYYTLRYADDIAILINGKFSLTVSEVIQASLYTVHQWCNMIHLFINSNKRVIIPFARRRDTRTLKEPTVLNNTIELSNEVSTLD
jgi:hypothetical protein